MQLEEDGSTPSKSMKTHLYMIKKSNREQEQTNEISIVLEVNMIND